MIERFAGRIGRSLHVCLDLKRLVSFIGSYWIIDAEFLVCCSAQLQNACGVPQRPSAESTEDDSANQCTLPEGLVPKAGWFPVARGGDGGCGVTSQAVDQGVRGGIPIKMQDSVPMNMQNHQTKRESNDLTAELEVSSGTEELQP